MWSKQHGDHVSLLQVRTFGFSDVVGLVSYPEEENREFGVRPYSENLDAVIDKEVSSLIFSAYKKTEEVLQANMDKLKLVCWQQYFVFLFIWQLAIFLIFFIAL